MVFDAEPGINEWLNECRWGHFKVGLEQFMKILNNKPLHSVYCLFPFAYSSWLLFETPTATAIHRVCLWFYGLAHTMQCEGLITKSAGLNGPGRCQNMQSHCFISSMTWRDLIISLLGILKGQWCIQCDAAQPHTHILPSSDWAVSSFCVQS